MNDAADVTLFADSRAAVMLGLAAASEGVGEVAFWKKRVQLDASFPPSGQITGVFQYTGNTESDDKIVVVKNGNFYTCDISANAPQLTPDALNFTSTQLVAIPNYSGISFATDQRVRAIQMNTEMIFVQEGGVYPVRYNGTAIYRLGIVTPPAPTDGGDTVGVMTGGAVYQYAITYADALGRESSPSTALSITMSGNGGRIINWTAPTDTQVTTVYLYRTVAGGSTFYRVVEGGIVGVSYGDTTVTDTQLVFHTQAPLAFENDPPQQASLISIYKFRLALNVSTDPRSIQISNLAEPGAFSQLGPVYNSAGQLLNATDGITLRVLNEFGDEITGIGHLGSVLGVFSRRTTGVLEGDNPAQYQFRMVHRIGCIAPDSIMECGNETVFMAEDGLYALDYQSGFAITKLSSDMDTLFRSASVLFDTGTTWPQTLIFTREGRATAAIAGYLQNRYVLATPPYTVIYDFDSRTMYLDYMTGMPYADNSESKGYLCMSRIHADRQYQVMLYSPGIGPTSGPLGDLYVMSFYPLTQDVVGVPEYNSFIFETRAMDGAGIARTRLKKFKRITLFGTIEAGETAGGVVTAEALFNGTVSLVVDDQYTFGPYPFDNLTQVSTQYVGADFANLAKRGILIEQELPADAVGRACQVLIKGQANGRLKIADTLVEYWHLEGN